MVGEVLTVTITETMPASAAADINGNGGYNPPVITGNSSGSGSGSGYPGGGTSGGSGGSAGDTEAVESVHRLRAFSLKQGHAILIREVAQLIELSPKLIETFN